MLVLRASTDLIRVITTQALNTDVHVVYDDDNGPDDQVDSGYKSTLIATATTTTVVAGSDVATRRKVRAIAIYNRGGAGPQVATVVHSDGTTVAQLAIASLALNESFHYTEGRGWYKQFSTGEVMSKAI